jgi:hypothetical protein
MRGTWQTTSGGSGGVALAVVIAAIVLAGSGAASAIASAVVTVVIIAAVWLTGRNRKQAARVGAELVQRRRTRPDQPARPIALQAVVQPPPGSRPRLEETSKPALEPGRELHLHFHGMSADQIAAVITRSNEEDK